MMREEEWTNPAERIQEFKGGLARAERYGWAHVAMVERWTIDWLLNVADEALEHVQLTFGKTGPGEVVVDRSAVALWEALHEDPKVQRRRDAIDKAEKEGRAPDDAVYPSEYLAARDAYLDRPVGKETEMHYNCATCGGLIDSVPLEDWHVYTHLQEMWPDRDYSADIASARRAIAASTESNQQREHR